MQGGFLTARESRMWALLLSALHDNTFGCDRAGSDKIVRLSALITAVVEQSLLCRSSSATSTEIMFGVLVVDFLLRLCFRLGLSTGELQISLIGSLRVVRAFGSGDGFDDHGLERQQMTAGLCWCVIMFFFSASSWLTPWWWQVKMLRAAHENGTMYILRTSEHAQLKPCGLLAPRSPSMM